LRTLLAAALLAALAAVGGCGGDGDGADDAVGEPKVEAEPGSRPPPPQPHLDIDARDDAYPVIWVRRGEEVEVRTEPGGGKLVHRAGKQTEYGSPSVFGVVRHHDGWAGVSTPELPNDRLGWIRLDPRRLRAGSVRTSIVIDLSDRRAELRRSDKAVRSFTVTVGAPGSDTPIGRYAVTDTFRGELNPAYGCCAVALSANQPNLPSGWLGGTRIAIHGTTGPLGVAASNGCVRAANPDVSALVDGVALGTPVFIRA
jgi:hypothetical protein